MKVCYFGSYDSHYSRSHNILEGLKAAKVDVIECNCRKNFLLRAPYLFLKGLLTKFDILLVGYPGQLDVLVAKLIALVKRKPLVFDVFMSDYDANVLDNKLIAKGSLRAGWLHFLDWLSCTIADRVIIDTEENIDFFNNEIRVDRKKFLPLHIGADEKIFYPRKKTEKKDFVILHYGRTSGLHGVEYIINAMDILKTQKDITLILIGDAESLRKYQKKERRNILFKYSVPFKDIPYWIESSDVCLGLFGGTEKSMRVIPNKVYEAIAMKKPVITGDSPAMRRVFKDKESIMLCEMKNPGTIADAILSFKKNPVLGDKIAKNAYTLFREKFTTRKIGRKLKNYLEKLSAS